MIADTGTPSVHSTAMVTAVVTFIQVFLGGGFRHQDMPIWPHMAGSLAVLGTTIWTAAVLRRRFDASSAMTFGRVLLHSTIWTQILFGVAAYWSRLTTADSPHPMPLMIWLTVIHTVFGALVFGSSILVVLLCYRLIPKRGEAGVASRSGATIG